MLKVYKKNNGVIISFKKKLNPLAKSYVPFKLNPYAKEFIIN
jgi:hypothetical protein